ncbi:MAG TPA: alpha/beta hydrolase [Gemmatimonadaceae bacterium]|nr:alpha/beta hydrolase [Gemmatimonadaceae bacterium]
MDADLLRIPVGPGSMHVERYGHGGSPILLVHGFGTCSFLWREVGPELASANRTAFAVDLFGYGESDRPFDAQFGIASQSDYLDHALTALRLTKATIVGVDLGGAVAMHLAYSRPERVERLVLVNPIAFDEVPADDVKMLQRNTARFAIRVSRGLLGAAPLVRELLERSVAAPDKMPDHLVARYMAPYVGQEGLNHLLSLARAVDGEDMLDVELGQLDCPTLIVWGDQDRFLSPKMADRLADTIPGSRLVRLPGTGRLVPEEAPETLANMILEFVGAAGTIARAD